MVPRQAISPQLKEKASVLNLPALLLAPAFTNGVANVAAYSVLFCVVTAMIYISYLAIISLQEQKQLLLLPF